MRRGVLAIALAACGGPAATAPPQPARPPVIVPVVPLAPVPAGPLDQDLPRLAAAVLAMQQALVGVLGAPAADCATTTAKLVELAPRYAEVESATVKVMREGRARELRLAVEPHQGAFDAVARAIAEAPVLTRCVEDRAFGAALDRLGEAP